MIALIMLTLMALHDNDDKSFLGWVVGVEVTGGGDITDVTLLNRG